RRSFGRFMIPSTARFVVGESHEPTARRPSGRPVSPSSGEDHRSSSSPSAVRGDNRLGFSGEALQFGISGGAGAAASADEAGGELFILNTCTISPMRCCATDWWRTRTSKPRCGEQTMRVGYVRVNKVAKVSSATYQVSEGLLSEFCSCYGSQHPNDNP